MKNPRYKSIGGFVYGKSICAVVGKLDAESTKKGVSKETPFFMNKKKPALTNFPRSRRPSIVGAKELNCCVRNGNRWNLFAINTGY